MRDPMRVRQPKIMALVAVLILCLPATNSIAQQTNSLKHFSTFRNLVPGIDFFAASRAGLEPLEKRLVEARGKLAFFFGQNLPSGAIVLCTTLEQKDSVSEARLLKMGYRWALVQVTPEVSNQQMLANIKAQMGGQVPPQMLERLKSADMKEMGMARLVDSTVQKYCAAVIMATLAPEKEFRSSRLDDMGRSPLEDWLDIAVAAQASGTTKTNLRFLQDHLEEAFPLEDISGGMARPFVAPSTGGGGGQGQFGGRMSGGASGGGPPSGMDRGGSSGGRGMGGGAMPKDAQDRMLFDLQACSFFDFIGEKLGMDKVRSLVQWNRDGKKSRDFLAQASMLGPDLDKIEKDWQEWVKAQKTEPLNRRNPANPNPNSQRPLP